MNVKRTKTCKNRVDKCIKGCYNDQAVSERCETAKRSLKTIQRRNKSFCTRIDAERGDVRRCIEQSDSERVKRLDEMKGS